MAERIIPAMDMGGGTAGTSGTDGTSGTGVTSGTSGTAGTDGTSGTSGTAGTDGTSGTAGTSGTGVTSGTSGTDGTSGTSGIDGTSGTSGIDGTSGTSGIDGTSGSSGTGAATFLQLSDTPVSYTGFAGYAPMVNALESALEFSSVLTATSAAMNLYVDSEGGNDANPGSIGSPVRTVQKAIDLVPQIVRHSVTIWLKDNNDNAGHHAVYDANTQGTVGFGISKSILAGSIVIKSDHYQQFVQANRGLANAAITTSNTTLVDTRLTMTPNAYVGVVITCNGKTMTVVSNTATTFTGASWSGGGNPGNGFAWRLGSSGVSTILGTGSQVYGGTPTWVVDEWKNGTVYLLTGTGYGQYRTVSSNTSTELTVSSPWTTLPDSTTSFIILTTKVRGDYSDDNLNVTFVGVGIGNSFGPVNFTGLDFSYYTSNAIVANNWSFITVTNCAFRNVGLGVDIDEGGVIRANQYVQIVYYYSWISDCYTGTVGGSDYSGLNIQYQSFAYLGNGVIQKCGTGINLNASSSAGFTGTLNTRTGQENIEYGLHVNGVSGINGSTGGNNLKGTTANSFAENGGVIY